MDINNTYKIPLRGVKAGKYSFEFKLDDAFFQSIEKSGIEYGEVYVEAEIERHNNMMIINFHLEGEVEVECDRCLDLFYIPVEADNILSVRFSSIMGENQEYLANEDCEEDVLFVDPNDDSMDVSHYLYESVYLSLPIQRVHPEDEDGSSLCNPEVIRHLKQHEIK